jgi:hypothetical protein
MTIFNLTVIFFFSRRPLTHSASSGDTDEVILFSRQSTVEDMYFNHFSIVLGVQTSVKNRVIVSYSGDDTGSGKWVCQKDRGNMSGCGHITRARHGLQKLVQADPQARDEMVHEEMATLG